MTVDFKRLFFLVFLLCGMFVPIHVAAAQDETPAEVGVFEDVEVSPNARFELPVSIRGVAELYAVDLTLRFDPEILQVVDADPDQAGVQLGLGPFLDAGLVLFNTADNETGTIRFAMTQVNPSEPKSGEGILLVIYAQSLAEGDSPVTVESVELSNRAGEAIAGTGVSSTVSVSGAAEAKESTPIPVQDPTEIIQVPTPQPTATPTESLDPTPTPTSAPEEISVQRDNEDQAVEQSANEVASAEEGEEAKKADSTEPETAQEADVVEPDPKNLPADQPSSGFSLLQYWWAVVILVALVILLGVYLAVTRR